MNEVNRNNTVKRHKHDGRGFSANCTFYLENCVSPQLAGEREAGQLPVVPDHVIGLN
jgi:hypothetical protein